MANVTVKAADGRAVPLSEDALTTLRGRLRGQLCLPGEPGYDTARTIWNAMIDRRPALIVRAAGAADVIATVNLARELGLVLAVRGGGHNIAGNAVCDGGLMLDLSPMKSVRVDPTRKMAFAEPGVTLGEFDKECQAFGLATPVGINSTTGLAGLTLGGGFGWLSRTYGLTVDNLRAADVVTADGQLLRASEKEHPGLFWAIRGGGGNFGVVTAFALELHKVGPEVLAGLVVHPFSDAKAVLEGYRKLAAKAPDGLTVWAVMRKAPPLPFLPPAVHGTPILVLAMCYAGDIKKGEKAAAPFRALGKPIADVVGPSPFVNWQTAFDPLLTPGARNYWKSHDFVELSDDFLALLRNAIDGLPTPDCEIFIGHLGGAVNEVKADATAYPHRNVHFVMNVHTRWSSPQDDARCIAWARNLFDQSAKYATGGVYVNFMPEDETQRVQKGAYGRNFARLAKLKAKYDPQNLFRMNQNIAPRS